MRPFGFEPDRVRTRAAEVDLIREAADRILDGSSVSSIANDWNERGIVTPAGNEWRPIVIKRVLISPRVAGKVIDSSGEERQAPWDPIVESDRYDRIVKLLTDASRQPAEPPSARSYLLTGGIAVCGLCDAPLIARPDNKGQRGYVCASGSPTHGCGKIRINGRLLEDEVATRLLARLIRSDARERLVHLVEKARARAVEAEQIIKESHSRLDALGEDYAAGNLTGASAKAATDKLKSTIADARKAMKLGEELKGIDALDADDIVEWWEGASVSQQRSLLSTIISKVAIHPAPVQGRKRFDPSRVKVVWRR